MLLLPVVCCFFFFHCSGPHLALHSFPTRRSSDLIWLRYVSGLSRSVLPLTAIDPFFGCISPMICLSTVLLPAPFNPINPMISPGLTLKETPCRTCLCV